MIMILLIKYLKNIFHSFMMWKKERKLILILSIKWSKKWNNKSINMILDIRVDHLIHKTIIKYLIMQKKILVRKMLLLVK